MRRRRFFLPWLLFILTQPEEIHADVTLNCVFLLDMNAFTARGLSTRYEAILTSAFSTPGGTTLQSIQSVSLTGVEVKQLYFPHNTDIRLFTVVHLTRVVASIRTDNDANTTKYISQFLAPLCADLAPVAIDRVGQPSSSAFDDFVQKFPPVLGFVMVVLWGSTIVSCGVCWGCLFCHCCKRKKEKPGETKPGDTKNASQADVSKPDPKESIANTAKNNPPDPAPLIISNKPQKKPRKPDFGIEKQKFMEQLTQPSAPPLFLMRLPLGLECADRSDPYAAPPSRGGPAAVRLASWPADPPPPPT